MAVATHHDHIGEGIRRVGQDSRGHVDIRRCNLLDIYSETVPSEMLAEIGPRHFIYFVRLIGNDDNLDLFGFLQERQSVGYRTRSGAASVPANHDAVQCHSAFLNERDEDDRPPGFEPSAFIDDLVGCRVFSLWLTDYNYVKASTNSTELVGGACNASVQDARFGRKTCALGCLLEPGNSRLRFFV